MPHHEDAQGYTGVFREMGKLGMRKFFDDVAEELRTEYLQRTRSDHED